MKLKPLLNTKMICKIFLKIQSTKETKISKVFDDMIAAIINKKN